MLRGVVFLEDLALRGSSRAEFRKEGKHNARTPLITLSVPSLLWQSPFQEPCATSRRCWQVLGTGSGLAPVAVGRAGCCLGTAAR